MLRTRLRPFDVKATLEHFSIVTYMVEPESLKNLIHSRFEPNIVMHEDKEWDLVSVVPFEDTNFRFSGLPFIKWRFAQTNYRAYVKDKETDDHVAWFFGTSLDSWTVNIPNRYWKLPWHRGRIEIDTKYSEKNRKYTYYQYSNTALWGRAKFSLIDTGNQPSHLIGFPTLEEGYSLLTDPSKGFYFRADGSLGSYSIFHERMQVSEGRLLEGSFQLLDELKLVKLSSTTQLHSILIQPKIDFEIHLPPKIVQNN